MLLMPTVDVSKYQGTNGEFTDAGSKKMLRDTSDELKRHAENRAIDVLKYTAIVNDIDRLLGEGSDVSYDKIGIIIDSYDYHKLRHIFTELGDFMPSYAVYKTESEAGIKNTIYDITGSVDNYVTVSIKTKYLFRRIQLYPTNDETAAFFSELIGIGVSVFYIIQMLRTLNVGDKKNVCAELRKLYEAVGRITESYILSEVVSKDIDEETKSIIHVTDSVPMNYSPTRICFATCVNDDRMYDECCYYISKQIVPDEIQLETMAVYDAKSMCAGYNEVLDATDADIVVYLHQDVCIINPFFALDIIDIFNSDKKIGMIGMVGSPSLPPDGVMWHGVRIGNLYGQHSSGLRYEWNGQSVNKKIKRVEAVDGLLIATNQRIRWREDLFDGWDFYDVSQSAEYLKRGLLVVVPEQSSPWVAHDDGMMNLSSYDKYRNIYLKEYTV